MRRTLTRKTTLAAALATVLVALTAGLLPDVSEGQTEGDVDANDPLVYRFVAAPDIFNQDIGDVRHVRGWDPGDPNSWTPKLEQATNTVLDEIQGQDPQSLIVSGDLVEGHWGRDDMHTGIFGPTRTVAQREANLRRAGRFYHGLNRQRFAEHGLTVHAAVGDHDIGDNPWNGPDERLRFKRHHIGDFRQLFYRAYETDHGQDRYTDRPVGTQWARTAYAVQLDPSVLLVTLDEFDYHHDKVSNQVVGGQLRWLRRVLADAKARQVPWVIVQGHMPVLTPVRERSSSGMSVKGGQDSPLWKAMVAGGVDLYLCGEVHDTTMRSADGLTQISTGTPLFLGKASYLVADVHPDRIDFTVHEFNGDKPGKQPIWQGSNMKTDGNVSYPDPSAVVGTMTLLANDQDLLATGKLAPYAG